MTDESKQFKHFWCSNKFYLHIARFPFFFQADCFEHSCLKSQGRFPGGILQKYSPCSTQSCIVFNALTNKTTSLLQQNCICFTKTAITLSETELKPAVLCNGALCGLLINLFDSINSSADCFLSNVDFRNTAIKAKQTPAMLRVTDSKYRESLDRFEKSKTLKLCLKSAFRELCSKMLFRVSKN